jgi:hypothetical protein
VTNNPKKEARRAPQVSGVTPGHALLTVSVGGDNCNIWKQREGGKTEKQKSRKAEKQKNRKTEEDQVSVVYLHHIISVEMSVCLSVSYYYFVSNGNQLTVPTHPFSIALEIAHRICSFAESPSTFFFWRKQQTAQKQRLLLLEAYTLDFFQKMASSHPPGEVAAFVCVIHILPHVRKQRIHTVCRSDFPPIPIRTQGTANKKLPKFRER